MSVGEHLIDTPNVKSFTYKIITKRAQNVQIASMHYMLILFQKFFLILHIKITRYFYHQIYFVDLFFTSRVDLVRVRAA